MEQRKKKIEKLFEVKIHLVAKTLEETLLFKAELLVELAPHAEPGIGVSSVRHGDLFPDSVEVASTTLATAGTDALDGRVGTGVQAGRGVLNAVAALLSGDTDEAGEPAEEGLDEDLDESEGPLADLEVPDTGVDEARVDTVDGDVLELLVAEQALVHLGNPDLEVELVVGVELDELASAAVPV